MEGGIENRGDEMLDLSSPEVQVVSALGRLPHGMRMLIRETDVESVFFAALDAKKKHGVLEAISRTLEEKGIMARSEKEQDAYRRLLVEGLTREPKKKSVESPSIAPGPDTLESTPEDTSAVLREHLRRIGERIDD